MELQQFRALFAATPDKYPFQLSKRHPAVMEKLLTHWDVPIEVEALFSKIMASASNLGGNGIAPDALLDLMSVRDVYRAWRDAQRPKAAAGVLREISVDRVADLLKVLSPPSPDVLAVMRQAFELAQADSPGVGALLASKGLNVNQRDADGLTALMICAQRGCEKAAVVLLKAGSNPHLTDLLGNTALHWAVIQNRRRLAELLLYFGANPNFPNSIGATAFSLASIKEDSALAQRLYEYGADIATQDLAGNTPLHKAVSAGSIENVWLLLLAGAPYSARNKIGVTAREIAEKNPEVWRIWDMHRVALRQSVI